MAREYTPGPPLVNVGSLRRKAPSSGSVHTNKRAEAEDRAAGKMQNWFRNMVTETNQKAKAGELAHGSPDPDAPAFGPSRVFGQGHKAEEQTTARLPQRRTIPEI